MSDDNTQHNEYARQNVVDEEHLKMLSIAYMVYAGIHVFFSLFGLFYMAIGIIISIALLVGSHAGAGNMPPFFFGFIFIMIGFGIFLFMIALGALKFYAGLCLRRKKSRVFCMVVAAISCLGIPYGTVLGILTFIVLLRPSVIALFYARCSAGVETGNAT